jgi:nuclear GTP-binding protein
MNLLEVESFEDTFGPKARRKKPKLDTYNFVNMIEGIEKKNEGYNHEKDRDLHKNDMETEKLSLREKVLGKGQSTRIWGELFKVIDSSDVLCIVIDARDPPGTRCYHVEEHLKKNCPHKHIVLIINKCDLVPTWVTQKWLAILSKDYPTIAYRASITSPYGKGSLINLLRQVPFEKFLYF